MTRRGLAFLTRWSMAGLAAAVLAVGGSAVVATAATGSASPAAWGQHVFASRHGDTQRAEVVAHQNGDSCQEEQNELNGDNDEEVGASASSNDNDQDEMSEPGCDNDQEGPNDGHGNGDVKAAKKTGDDDRQVTEGARGKDDDNGGEHGHSPRPSPK